MGYTLRDFGSYTLGGRTHVVRDGTPREVQFTRSASYLYDPRGHFAVEQTYVQYFVPETARDVPPVVLIHGGGMHGSTWETTPDGRPGWLHLLLDRGYPVHVVDLVERGRSGFAPGIWPDEPILRSAEEAWTLFRFGARDDFAARRPHPGLQFPIARFDAFLQRGVPRWLSTTPLQTAGVVGVLDRLGTATIVCHSQGGEIAFDAARQRPNAVSGILAVEPSAFPDETLDCPVTILAGDYLDREDHWRVRRDGWIAASRGSGKLPQRRLFLDTVREIAPGGSHFLMMDRHSDRVLELGLSALNATADAPDKRQKVSRFGSRSAAADSETPRRSAPPEGKA